MITARTYDYARPDNRFRPWQPTWRRTESMYTSSTPQRESSPPPIRRSLPCPPAMARVTLPFIPTTTGSIRAGRGVHNAVFRYDPRQWSPDFTADNLRAASGFRGHSLHRRLRYRRTGSFSIAPTGSTIRSRSALSRERSARTYRRRIDHGRLSAPFPDRSERRFSLRVQSKGRLHHVVPA